MRRRWICLLLMAGLLTAIPLFSGCGSAPDTAGAGSVAGQQEPEPEPEEPVSLEILCAGDIMVHEPQIRAQYDSGTGACSFENNFADVKPWIEAADLALCNLETTFGGTPYTGYPTFSSPDELAAAVRGAGFDVVMTANNHTLDRGATGVRRTLEVARGTGLITTGTRLETEKNYAVVSAAGVSVGVVSWTYESPQVNGRRTLNGIYVSDEAEPMINSFGYETMEEDLSRIRASMDAARADGAEILIAYFHWGNEYQREPDQRQRDLAARAAEYGADIIFASHPHVLQGAEMLTTADGRQVPVYYSMGNFLSNQRVETTGSEYTERGMLAVVRLSWLPQTRMIETISMHAVPTWVDKYKSGGRDIYRIIPLDGGWEENPTLQASGHQQRAGQALEYSRSLLGEEMLLQWIQ